MPSPCFGRCDHRAALAGQPSVPRIGPYVAETFGTLHCLDAETGQCCWTHDTKAEIWGSTLVADGKVYLGTQKSFWVFAAGREKKVLHEIRLGSSVYTTPIVANGVLYAASQRYLWAVRADRRAVQAAKR